MKAYAISAKGSIATTILVQGINTSKQHSHQPHIKMAAQTRDFSQVKALFFDVFGTVVDWRSTVTRELQRAAEAALSSSSNTIPDAAHQKAASMSSTDWGAFAAAWRSTYYAFTRGIANSSESGKPYKTVDEHHYDSLKELLQQWKLEGLWNEDEVREMSLVWHRLDPWPDACEGIRRLNRRATTCTLSNGNVKLLEDMAAYAKLEWTEVFSSEMFASCKPNPKVYLGAAAKLGLKPEECGMVAAHLSDLEAARKCGFRTVYVERSQEEAWDAEKVAQTRREGWVDIWVTDEEEGFIAIATRLG